MKYTIKYNPDKTLWQAVTVHARYTLHPAITTDEELGLNYESFALVKQTTGEVSEVDYISILLAEFGGVEISSVEPAEELPEHTHPYMPKMLEEGWLQKFDQSFRAMCKRLGWKLVYTEFETL